MLQMIAKKNHTTVDEVRTEMQKAIDEMWEMGENGANPPSEENLKLKEFFNYKKPSTMEFVNYCAGAVQSSKGVKL